MGDNSPFLILEKTCDDAIAWFTEQVAHAGLQVARTFDLQVARHENLDCPCPYHGTDQCDCQMVVLLVFQSGHQPISIVTHGYNGQTCFSVVDNPQQRADPRLEATINHALRHQVLDTIDLPEPSAVSRASRSTGKDYPEQSISGEKPKHYLHTRPIFKL